MERTNQPLMLFLARLALSSAVLGSVVALAGVSAQTVVSLLNQEQVAESDESIRKRSLNRDLFTTVEQRIQTQEAMINRLKSPIIRKEEQRNLATLYGELGRRSLTFNQMPRAEEAFQKSASLDPGNPQYLSELANLYATAAMRQAEAKQRVSLLRSSSELWKNAASATQDTVQRVQYRNGAASAIVGLASEFTRAGLTREALRELTLARDLAEDGSPLELRIDQLLSEVGR